MSNVSVNLVSRTAAQPGQAFNRAESDSISTRIDDSGAVSATYAGRPMPATPEVEAAVKLLHEGLAGTGVTELSKVAGQPHAVAAKLHNGFAWGDELVAAIGVNPVSDATRAVDALTKLLSDAS